MVIWKSRSCPRCQGDMFVEKGLDGWYRQCLQCSYRQDFKKPTKHNVQSIGRGKELVGAGGDRSPGD